MLHVSIIILLSILSQAKSADSCDHFQQDCSGEGSGLSEDDFSESFGEGSGEGYGEDSQEGSVNEDNEPTPATPDQTGMDQPAGR